jgi:hypothetical protein
LIFRITGKAGAALVSTLFLGWSFYFWSAAVMAEVYTLHVLLLAAMLLTLTAWLHQPKPGRLNLLALLFGLGLANHLSTLLLGPGLLIGLLAGPNRRPSLRQLGRMTLLVGVGLLFYLYLPLRSAAQPATRGIMDISVNSGADWLTVLSGRSFWQWIFAHSGPAFWQQMIDYLYALWGNFLSVGLVIGLVGIVALFQRQRTLAVVLTLCFLANAVFFIGYGAPDKDLMFLPTYLIWTIWLACGLAWLVAQGQGLFESERAQRWWSWGLAAACLSLPLAALLINLPYVDLSHDRRSYERAERMIEAVDSDAYLIVTHWADLGPLQYLQLVEQRRPDVAVVNGLTLTPSTFKTTLAVQPDRPHYLTSRPDWPLMSDQFNYRLDCRCYQID